MAKAEGCKAKMMFNLWERKKHHLEVGIASLSLNKFKGREEHPFVNILTENWLSL